MGEPAAAAVPIKRVYETPSPDDGLRILVDRLWPRGLKREAAELDRWVKDVAPSPDLRTWWNHDPARMTEFAHRYRAELAENPAVSELQALVDGGTHVTLLFAAKDEQVNHALVLAEYLAGNRPRPPLSRPSSGRA